MKPQPHHPTPRRPEPDQLIAVGRGWWLVVICILVALALVAMPIIGALTS